jgi:hypothetical protein
MAGNHGFSVDNESQTRELKVTNAYVTPGSS